MLATYPSAWLLLTLPFLSSCLIRSIPPLLSLAGRRNRTMRAAGMVGMAGLFAGLLGVVPPAVGLPMMVIGGLVSGFTVFTLPRGRGSDGDDWRRWRPPPEDPPPPDTYGPTDWEQFDRIRAQWERRPVLR